MILTLYFTTSLGGDHTIVLPILRSLYKVYGPISVIHFDAHLDTWGKWSPQERITHGSFFYIAHEEGLLSNTSVHAGIRCKMIVGLNLVTGCNCARFDKAHVNRIPIYAQDEADLIQDEDVGFSVISTDDIDDIGINEVIRRIRARIADNPVYLRRVWGR